MDKFRLYAGILMSLVIVLIVGIWHFRKAESRVDLLKEAFAQKYSGISSLESTVKAPSGKTVRYKIFSLPDASRAFFFLSSDFAPEVQGYAGAESVWIAVDKNGTVLDFNFFKTQDTPEYEQMVMDEKKRYLGKNIFNGQPFVEVVTGATYSSTGLSNALSLAGQRFHAALGCDGHDCASHNSVQAGKEASKCAHKFFHFFCHLFSGGWLATLIISLFALAALVIRYSFKQVPQWIRFIYLLAVILVCGVWLRAQFSTESVINILKLNFPLSPGIPFMLLLVIPVLMLFVGNIYCGWLCPCGAAQELAGFFVKARPPKKLWKNLRFIKYILLFVILALYFTGINTDSYRGDILLYGSPLIFIVIFASLFMSRFYCRNICPAGAFLSLFNPIQILARIPYFKNKISIFKPGNCDMGIMTFKEKDCLNCKRCNCDGNYRDSAALKGVKLVAYIAVCLVIATFVMMPVLKLNAAEGSSGLQEEIKLPEPALDKSKSFVDALKNRQSIRSFDTSKDLSTQTLANLLWAATGVNRESGKLTVPSTRNWQEITVYVAMKSGVYKYDTKAHKLIPVIKDDIRVNCGVQSFVKNAPVCLIYVAELSKMKDVRDSKEQTLMYAAVDSGFISQNVYLFCASENMATVVLGGVKKDDLATLIKLDKENQLLLFTQPVGYQASVK